MKSKLTYTENNIEKLLQSSIRKEFQPNQQLKDDTLQFLLPKVAQHKKMPQTGNLVVIGLSFIWIAIALFTFSELKVSIYMLDLIKPVLGLSLVLIPVSSIILIILKSRFYEKQMV